MRELKYLAMVLTLGLYYVCVLLPMQSEIESNGLSGTVQKLALEREVGQIEKSHQLQTQRIAERFETLGQRFGSLRLTPDDAQAPLDALLNSIEQSARELGITIDSIAPTQKTRTGMVEQEGFLCRFGLPGEAHLGKLLDAIHARPASRDAMLHALTLTKTKQGVGLELSLGVLRRAPVPAGRVTGPDFDTLARIKRDHAPFKFAGLLETAGPTAATSSTPAANR